VFGFGKEKIYIDQFCRLVQLKIYEKIPLEMDYIDSVKVLSEHEHKILNADLFTSRFVAFNLLMLREAIRKRTKRSSEDLGFIGVHSLKLILQDKGHSQMEIDEFVEIYLKQAGYQAEMLFIVDFTHPNIEIIRTAVTIGFVRYFGDLFDFPNPIKANGELDMSNHKQASVMVKSLEVFKLVESIYLEEHKIYKIVDL
jgi:hypothetical protein